MAAYGRAFVHKMYEAIVEDLPEAKAEEDFLASILTPSLNIPDERTISEAIISPSAPAEKEDGVQQVGPSTAQHVDPTEKGSLVTSEEQGGDANGQNTPGEWRWMLEDPSLNDDKFTEFIKRNARKMLSSLQDAAALGRVLAEWKGSIEKPSPASGDFKEGSSTRIHAMEDWIQALATNMPSLDKRYLPATWWTSTHDAALLLGSHRHGLARYEQLREDPLLPFPKAKLADASTNGTETEAGGKPHISELVNDPPAQRETSEQKKDWPGVKILNQRFRKILRAFEQSLAKRARKRDKREKGTSDKIDKKWSKREKYDFQRSLVRHGVPVDKDGAYCWDKIRSSARLSRKTPKAIEKYYVAFLERAKNSIQEHKNRKKSGIARHSISCMRCYLSNARAWQLKPRTTRNLQQPREPNQTMVCPTNRPWKCCK